ncbi:MAG: hypothetical protein IIZ66_03235 [Clostridia bacterium]|nr:hypothetical protein [Clostridia bacterium]
MNKTKKLLSVLLAFVLVFGSAATAAYAEDGMKAESSRFTVISADDAATMILDTLEGVLKSANITFDMAQFLKDLNFNFVDYDLYSSRAKEITADFTSVDNALDGLYRLIMVWKGEHGTYENGEEYYLISGGDVDEIHAEALAKPGTNWDDPNLLDNLTAISRADGDLNVLYALLQFVADSRVAIADFISGKFTLGSLIGSENTAEFVSQVMYPMLYTTMYQLINPGENGKYTVSQWLMSSVYKALLVEMIDGYDMENYVLPTPEEYVNETNGLTNTLNTFIREFLAQNGITSQGDIDLSTMSLYQIIDAVLPAVYNDIGKKLFENSLKVTLADLLGSPFLGGAVTKTQVGAADLAPEALAAMTENGSVYNDSGNKAIYARTDAESGAAEYFKYDYSASQGLAGYIDFGYTAPDFEFADSDILGQLNDVLGTVINMLLNEEGETAVGWTFGGNEEIRLNLFNTLSFLVDKLGIDLSQFLIYFDPSNEHSDLLQFASYMLEPFLADVSPDMDFTAEIYKDDTLSELADHDDDGWLDVLLQMGLEVAMHYLNVYTDYDLDGQAVLELKAAGWGTSDFVNHIADWALSKLGPETVSAAADVIADITGDDPDIGWKKLSYVINSLLPLGFISGVESDDPDYYYAFDLEKFIRVKLKNVLIGEDGKAVDLAALIDMIREPAEEGEFENILTLPAEKAVIRTLRRLVNAILPGAIGADYTKTFDAFLSADGLRYLVINLLGAINNRKQTLFSGAGALAMSFIDSLTGRELPLVTFNAETDTVETTVSRALLSKAGIAEDTKATNENGVRVIGAGTIFADTVLVDRYSSGAGILKLEYVDGENIVAVPAGYIYTDRIADDGTGEYHFRVSVADLAGDGSSAQTVGAADEHGVKFLTAVSYLLYVDDGGNVQTAYSGALKIRLSPES